MTAPADEPLQYVHLCGALASPGCRQYTGSVKGSICCFEKPLPTHCNARIRHAASFHSRLFTRDSDSDKSLAPRLCSDEGSCSWAPSSSRQVLMQMPRQSVASGQKRLRHSRGCPQREAGRSARLYSCELQPVRSNRKFERHFATATSSSFWLRGRRAVL